MRWLSKFLICSIMFLCRRFISEVGCCLSCMQCVRFVLMSMSICCGSCLPVCGYMYLDGICNDLIYVTGFPFNLNRIGRIEVVSLLF